MEIEDDNLGEWKVTLPLGVIYGDCRVHLTFGEGYPFDPPTATIPHIYHPNVYPGAQLCISILESQKQEIFPGEEGNSAAERWSPALGAFALLQGIFSVLMEPNVDSPANPEANRDFMSDYKKYLLQNEKLKTLREERNLKREQEELYNQVLLVDQHKKKREEEAELEVETRKKVKREAREMLKARGEIDQAEASSRLPPEPEEIASIRFRTPTETFARRFLSSEPLSAVFLYLRSMGYRIEVYKVLMSFPWRDLTSLPAESTMADLKFVPQETLTLEDNSQSDSESDS